MKNPENNDANQSNHSTIEQSFQLVFVRETPLTPAELRDIVTLWAEPQRDAWNGIRNLRTAPMDGFGDHRFVVEYDIRANIHDPSESDRMVALLNASWTLLSGSHVMANDPTDRLRFGAGPTKKTKRSSRTAPQTLVMNPTLDAWVANIPDGWTVPPTAKIMTAPNGQPDKKAHPLVGSWNELPEIGRLFLGQPGLGAFASEEDGPDKGAGDDLTLPGTTEYRPERTCIAQALENIATTPQMRGCQMLGDDPEFVEQATAALGGSTAGAVGAAALIASGLWPTRRLPSVFEQLAQLHSTEQVWPIRALALRAIAAAEHPDSVPLILREAQSTTPEIAAEALLALARVPGQHARRTARCATRQSGNEAIAIAGLALAKDTGSFPFAAELVHHKDPDVRKTAIRHLFELGGTQALPLLESMTQNDENWEVRNCAAQQLGELGQWDSIAKLLTNEDEDTIFSAIEAARTGANHSDWSSNVKLVDELNKIAASHTPEGTAARHALKAVNLAIPELDELLELDPHDPTDTDVVETTFPSISESVPLLSAPGVLSTPAIMPSGQMPMVPPDPTSTGMFMRHPGAYGGAAQPGGISQFGRLDESDIAEIELEEEDLILDDDPTS